MKEAEPIASAVIIKIVEGIQTTSKDPARIPAEQRALSMALVSEGAEILQSLEQQSGTELNRAVFEAGRFCTTVDIVNEKINAQLYADFIRRHS